MAIRRALLLILGLMCSVFVAMVLYISAESTLAAGDSDTKPMNMQATLPEMIQLPYAIPGTTLIAERMSGYDGPFLEDGTDREVVNVSALHVKNVGTKAVRNAAVFLTRGDTGLAFYGEYIPAGATVVLLEITAASYQKGNYSACTGSQMLCENDSVLNSLSITDKSMGTLIVTNTSDSPMYNLCLYYKVWLSPPDVYMGGISYTVELPLLMPHQTAYLYPNHYASGYSKVVGATADQ